MNEDSGDAVLDFLREQFARVDARLDELRREVETLRARQDQMDVLARDMASWAHATLARIERKLSS